MTMPASNVITITSMAISGKYHEPNGVMSLPSTSRSTGVTPTHDTNCSKNVQSGLMEVHGTHPTTMMANVRTKMASTPF